MTTLHGIDFKDGELLKAAQDGLYIVKYRTILQPKYSENTGEGLQKIYSYKGKLPLTKRGRFHTMKKEEVNSLLGFELLIA